MTVRIGSVTCAPADSDDLLATGRVTLAVGAHVVLTVSHGAGGDLTPVARALLARRPNVATDQWTVVYAVAQHLVAGYPAALEEVATQTNTLEEGIFSTKPDSGEFSRLYELKRELIELRRAVVPAQWPLTPPRRPCAYACWMRPSPTRRLSGWMIGSCGARGCPTRSRPWRS